MPVYCKYVGPGNVADYRPGADRTAGQVQVIGTRVTIVPKDIDFSDKPLGSLSLEGIWDVPQAVGSTITAGDLVHWNAAGNPVDGTAGTGAANDTATGNLMGVATPEQPNGTATTAATDQFVRVKLAGMSLNIAAIGGSMTALDITGADATLTVTGLAAVGAGDGGLVSCTGGLAHTNGAGGAASVTGGAGSAAGLGAGGVASLTGGASAGGATGNGGAATVTGGAAASVNGAGGNAGVTGGAGTGTGAGGAVNLTGGASGAGATGNGGAATVAGGVPISTDGAGGLASVTGGAGVGTGAGGAASLVSGASGAGLTGDGGAVAITAGAAASTDGNGGTITLTPGALAGTGYAGRIHLDGFVAGWTAQTIDMADAQVALTRKTLTGNWLLVDAASGTTENLLLPPEADMVDVLLIIKNTGGESIFVQNDAAGAIGEIATAECAFVHCDGTTWTIIQMIETT